jgi:hypothetical protein
MRNLAATISYRPDREELLRMAEAYEADARRLDRPSSRFQMVGLRQVFVRAA